MPWIRQLLLCGLLSITITQAIAVGHPVDALPMAEIRALASAYNDIRRYYVDPIDDKIIFKNAIRGMVSALDPHSDFIDGEAFDALQESIVGSFGGIGIEVKEQSPGVFMIAAVLDHTPAAKAHLHAGDHIIKIANTLTTTMTLRELVKQLRGPQHSLLRMTLIRPHHNKPIVVLLSRDVITFDNITVKLIDGHYLWIHINEFQENTLALVLKMLATIPPKNLYGLILDIRNNPGGLLSSAVDLCSLFLEPQSLIVFTKNTHHPEQSRRYLSHTLKNIDPAIRQALIKQAMIVLVNNGSASAAEIVAGALKDHHRAIIMGSRTFGKGTVQTTFPIKELKNTIIKLTTARYYTPSGYSIQERGITPDIDLSNDQPILPIYEDNLGRHLKNEQHTPPPQDSQIEMEVPPQHDTNVNAPTSTANTTEDHELDKAVQLLKTWRLFKKQEQQHNSPGISKTSHSSTP